MLSYRSFITFHCRSHTNKITNVTRLLNSVFSNSFVNVLAESSSVRGVGRKVEQLPVEFCPKAFYLKTLFLLSAVKRCRDDLATC